MTCGKFRGAVRISPRGPTFEVAGRTVRCSVTLVLELLQTTS
jgi:hypothetical protein